MTTTERKNPPIHCVDCGLLAPPNCVVLPIGWPMACPDCYKARTERRDCGAKDDE